MHLADIFIKSYLRCIQGTVFDQFINCLGVKAIATGATMWIKAPAKFVNVNVAVKFLPGILALISH